MNFLITLHAFSTHKAIIHFKDSKVYVIVFSKRKFCNGGKCHFSCGLRSFHIYSNIWKHPKRQKNRHYLRKEKQARRECHGREKLCGTIAPTTIGYVPKEILPYTRYIVEQMYKHFVTSVVINVKEG